MNDRAMMKQVIAAIRKHRSFVVTAHINPEGDAIGSALAVAFLLKRLGKKVTVANDGGMPKAFEFLPHNVPVTGRPAKDFSPEVSIIVDVPVFGRVGAIKPLIERVPLVVCIDHHVSNQRFADINWVDPKAASVGEMIYRLYRAFGLKPRLAEAICMYVSVVSDTGSFRYMSTTPAVHQIAADLIATGVSPLKIAQQLYESRSAADLKFLGTLLRSIRVSPDGQIAWLEVPAALVKASKASPEIIDELVNFPRSIRSAEVAFVAREDAESRKIRVSFRSKGNADVNKIAQVFGGGGHIAASGCTIDGTLAQARSKVLKAARLALAKKK